jgi:DNA-directed RNA polymerase subunit RPC12/RpoP
MRTLDMFGKPRKKREWLMHVDDCGNDNCGPLEDGEQFVSMKCNRCGLESGWIVLPTITAVKRGIPCERCNAKEAHE